jgi:uncharacterized protein YegP (UPF0339 family)
MKLLLITCHLSLVTVLTAIADLNVNTGEHVPHETIGTINGQPAGQNLQNVQNTDSVNSVHSVGRYFDHWLFYKDAKREWRWKRVAPNGRVVAGSNEGYKNKSGCVENARRNGYQVAH